MNEVPIEACVNCGHEWLAYNGLGVLPHCPLCRWPMDKVVKHRPILGDRPITPLVNKSSKESAS